MQLEKCTLVAIVCVGGIARRHGQVSENGVAELAVVHSASLIEVEASDRRNRGDGDGPAVPIDIGHVAARILDFFLPGYQSRATLVSTAQL